MRFVYRERPSLPRLAWLARFGKERDEVEVTHGPWVEARDRFFVEGAWDGPFHEGGFADSQWLMGSGGIAESNGVLLCSASHPLERLYLLRDGDELLVSPSLVFALEAGRARLDLHYIPYQADLIRFQQGLANHVGELPLSEGRSLTVLHFRNLRIDESLNVSVLPKPESPRFRDFAHYRSFLIEGMEALWANARAPERKIAYEPLATLSSGYDSTACAALARDLGCREAVTFTSARPGQGDGEGVDDSGSEIGALLGYEMLEFDRDYYRSLDTLPEAEFVACGDLGQDVVITAMEGVYERKLVITGEHGDTMWSRHWDVQKDERGERDIKRRSCAGCSTVEFRLRVGFFHLPLPCVAATSLPDLMRISQSEEMRPWTLFTRYDRPIARRIAEEKGVSRHLFGQEKKAVTALLNRGAFLERLMSPISYASFREFYERRARERSAPHQALYTSLFRLYRLYDRLFRRVNRGLARLGIARGVPCPVPERFRHPPGEPSFLFHWGVDRIRGRYAIDGVGSEGGLPRGTDV